MKKCANCNFENPDDATSCQSCSTETFVSSSPEAIGGHIISPEEQHFLERMTFRQFAILFVRMQALWLFINALIDTTYLPRFFRSPPPGAYYAALSQEAKLDLCMLILRIALNVAGGIACIQFASRIISWLVKDLIPRNMTNKSTEK